MTATPDDLYESLRDFVVRLVNQTEGEGMDALIDLDLSLSQVRAVFVLAKTREPMAIHSIAEALGLSVAAMGRNVDRLVKLAVVERRECTTDRRVKLVSLTAAGQQLTSRHVEAKRDALRSFATALPADQRDQLHQALSSILAGDTLPQHHDQENFL